MAPETARRTAQTLYATLLMALICATGALAQSVQGDPADLEFKIINATTGQPGSIDRLEIDHSTMRLDPVLDVQPTGSEFIVPEVPIMDVGGYIVTAWYGGVPYFWSIRGRKLLDGPLTLHVFDTTDSLDDVEISGLNLLIRKGESVVSLEYMIKVENTAQPQATVVGEATVELAVPSGASDFQATYTRGPEPSAVPVSRIGANRIGLAVPLTSGQNQIRVVGTVPWTEGMQILVGSNLAVASWSLLATPENLDIQATELVSDDSQDLPGYLRFIGPALERGREFAISIKGRIPSGTPEEVFTTEAPADLAQTAGKEKEKGGNYFPLILLVPIIVILTTIAVRKRRS